MGQQALGRKVKAYWKAQAEERALKDASLIAAHARDAAYRALTGSELGAVTRHQNPYEARVRVKVAPRAEVGA